MNSSYAVSGSPTVEGQEVCAFCQGRPRGILVPCSECHGVKYCSLLHRNAHRPEHKLDCARLQRLRKERMRTATPSPTFPHSPVRDFRPVSISSQQGSYQESSPGHSPAASAVSPAYSSRLATRSAPAPVVALPSPPPDFAAEIGRASWKVLHAVAERYPPYPTAEQMDAAIQFMRFFAIVYPCEKCRIHFQTLLQQHPPDVSSQVAFVKWMSFFHDQVNLRLGKPAQAVPYLVEKGLPAEAAIPPTQPMMAAGFRSYSSVPAHVYSTGSMTSSSVVRPPPEPLYDALPMGAASVGRSLYGAMPRTTNMGGYSWAY